MRSECVCVGVPWEWVCYRVISYAEVLDSIVINQVNIKINVTKISGDNYN